MDSNKICLAESYNQHVSGLPGEVLVRTQLWQKGAGKVKRHVVLSNCFSKFVVLELALTDPESVRS